MPENIYGQTLPLLDHEENRKRFIESMREMLDFIESNPQVPAPTANYGYDFTYGSFGKPEFEENTALICPDKEFINPDAYHGMFHYRWRNFGAVRLVVVFMACDGQKDAPETKGKANAR